MCPLYRQHDKGYEEEEGHNKSCDVDPIGDLCSLLKACNSINLR